MTYFAAEPDHITEIRRQLSRWVAEKMPRETRRQWDREATWDRALFREIAEMGLIGLTIPEEYGGQGEDIYAAAAVIVASEEAVKAMGLKPMARIVSWGHAGVEPEYMGEGPIKAVPVALQRAGLTLDQIDVIESNEAFAAQAAAVAKELGFDPEKVNPNGSGVSLGHPVGATGTILTVKAIYELKRIGGKYGLITMCIGGGQGIALVIENVG